MKKLILPLLLILISCGNDKTKSSDSVQNVSAIYASSALDVKIYYETGAEPYTTSTPLNSSGTLKLWDVLEKNLEALFQGKAIQPVITVPKELNQMTEIPSSDKTQWSLDDVLELSRKHTVSSPQGTSTFFIYFLNGYAKESSGIIAFHISNTKVMAVFKDMIRASSETEYVAQYVEQATVIHELGHAFGLVNNGLPMVSDHQDTPNKAHCTNKNCVMYYQNEGSSSMVSYLINNVIKNGSSVMFDAQCLKDAQSYGK